MNTILCVIIFYELNLVMFCDSIIFSFKSKNYEKTSEHNSDSKENFNNQLKMSMLKQRSNTSQFVKHKKGFSSRINELGTINKLANLLKAK